MCVYSVRRPCSPENARIPVLSDHFGACVSAGTKLPILTEQLMSSVYRTLRVQQYVTGKIRLGHVSPRAPTVMQQAMALGSYRGVLGSAPLPATLQSPHERVSLELVREKD